MARKTLWAPVEVCNIPRVRFFKTTSEPGKAALLDITSSVTRVELEELDDDTGCCNLTRFDAAGKVVWKTRHPSRQETLWHAEFEYGLAPNRWNAFNGVSIGKGHLAEAKAAINSPRALANGLVAEATTGGCGSGEGSSAERDDLLAKIAAKKAE